MEFIEKVRVTVEPPYPAVWLHYYEVQGRLECMKVEIEARPSAPLSTTLIRRIPWRSIMESNKRGILAHYQRREKATRGWKGSEIREEALRLLPIAERGLRPQRARQYGPEHFAEVAAIYSQAWRAGDRAPTKAVADAKQVSRSTAAKWVATARELKLLPKTKKRVARGRKR